jgi:hypothetical protein
MPIIRLLADNKAHSLEFIKVMIDKRLKIIKSGWTINFGPNLLFYDPLIHGIAFCSQNFHTTTKNQIFNEYEY